MTKKIVGKVTVEEKNEIYRLFKRRNSLKELFSVVKEDESSLYGRLLVDMDDTLLEYNQWWSSMSEKYNWESHLGAKWTINFDTCEVYLKEDDNGGR